MPQRTAQKKREIPSEEVIAYVPPDAEADLHDAVSSLEEKLRLPVVLHYLQGYTTREVAQILRTPESTIKSRLARARQLLGEMIAPKEVLI